MMWTFNEKIVSRMIRRAVRLFSRSKNVNKEEVRDLKCLAKRAVVIMNERLTSTWGVAYMVDANISVGWHKELRDRYGLHRNHFHQKLKPKSSNRSHYFLILLSSKICQYIPVTEVYDTVAHELAHLLHFFIEGNTSHDKTWKRYHQSMNGNGEAYSPYSVPSRVFKSKNPIKKK